ncbi:MAG TPA: DUF3011 domain-containing protein [Longimicrobium sp.]|jgi:hypothetical protein
MIRKAALALSSLAIAGLLALSPSGAEAQTTITCESRGHDRAYCAADTRGGVRLVRQLSDARCESGRSWGADRSGIWVSQGCRGQFAVGSTYGGGQWGGSGRGDGRYGDRDGRYGGRDGRYDGRDRRYDDRDNRYDHRSRRAMEERAERVCRAAVGERLRNIRRSDVRADYRGRDRAGNLVVRWDANRVDGSCIVSTGGRVLDIRYDRRR